MNMGRINESLSLEGVGELVITWDFDQESYEDWLEEMEYSNDSKAFMQYINDYITFDVELFDNETYHHMAYETCDYSDLEESIGENFAADAVNILKDRDEYRVETIEIYNSELIDANNPEELNARAMQVLDYGEYYKDCRGFILTNGVVVYTPTEHNQVSQIYGIKGTFDFIKKGNIRVLPQSIDLGMEPTAEQRSVLRKVIGSYSDEELYVDIIDGNGSVGTKYTMPTYQRVMGEIDRYFSEGIRLMGECITESYSASDNIFLMAENYFGTTYDIRECEYILPDGKMLDFSGRHMVNGDASHLKGRRGVDHREVYIIGWSKDGMTKNFDIGMNDFIRAGAIRTSVGKEYSYIELYREPTKEQENVIKRIVCYCGGNVDVEIGDGNESISFVEFEDANPMRVIVAINKYFSEGIKLEASNRKINEASEKDSVQDVEFVGYPDQMGLFINGKNVCNYSFQDSQAYPFIIFNGKLHIGEGYGVHKQMFGKIKDIKNTQQPIIKGRIWVGAKTNDFNYSVVSFWGSDTNEDLRPYVYQVAQKLKVNPSKIVVVAKIGSFGDRTISKPIPLSQWNGTIHQLTSNEVQHQNLHMMDSEEKFKRTGDFRKTRDEKLGKKMTNSRGEEMPMAKYRSMIYQESSNPVNVIITESQYKRLFRRKK